MADFRAIVNMALSEEADEKQKIREYNKAYMLAHGDAVRAARKAKYHSDPSVRERIYDWRKSVGREKMRAIVAAHRERNRDKWSEERGANPLPSLVKGAMGRAKKYGLDFDPAIIDCLSVPHTCPILGIPIFCSKGRSSPNSPSIDRFDNSKGYVVGNVWVISRRANSMKSDSTAQDLLAFGFWCTTAFGLNGSGGPVNGNVS